MGGDHDFKVYVPIKRDNVLKMLNNTISHHIISYHITSCHIVWYCIVSYHIIYHIISYHTCGTLRLSAKVVVLPERIITSTPKVNH